MRAHLGTLVDDFRRHAEQTALVTYRGNRRIVSSYGTLAEVAERFAGELANRHIGCGERVAIWGSNGAEWVGAFFGCVLRGVIAVPLDAAGSLDFAERVLAETSPKLIVGDAGLLSSLHVDTPTLVFEKFAETLTTRPLPAHVDLDGDTPLQILFTSGTTAEPKGIVHTHRNVLASLLPIEREMQKYLRYERLVHPLRFLHTLPLSHVFGQFMGLWIPSLLAAEVHFETRLQAPRLVELIRTNRISVLAAVPRVLSLLKAHLEAEDPALHERLRSAAGIRAWRRWWRFRGVHGKLGFKFWAFVCGGASLPTELESFWRDLGFVVIQGYGMTETAALITLNHPFQTGHGTIGKALPGREIRISDDGEIQVRGEMVSNSTWQQGRLVRRDDPWLATGDLASRDESGSLHFLGRKSDVIVTAAGLNVHPEDVESALRYQPGVTECVVVGVETPLGPEPAAALLFRGEEEQAGEAVRAANAELAEFQRIRRWALWEDIDFPRTTTGKIQRRKVAARLAAHFNGQQADRQEAGEDALLDLIATISGTVHRGTSGRARLAEDLGLDSLGRVQLQSEIEQRWSIAIPDAEFAQIETLDALRRRVSGESAAETIRNALEPPPGKEAAGRSPARDNIVTSPALQEASAPLPTWTWSVPVQAIRVLFVELVMRPLVRVLGAPVVLRDARFEAPRHPVLIVSNHVTAYDGALVLYALPGAMRRHVAAAMAADMLADLRRGRGQGNWLRNLFAPAGYWLLTALFNVFPLPRNAGFRRAFAHAGRALDRGFHVLLFPEGRRSVDGTLQRFRAGIGLLTHESRAQVLPIALRGLGELKQSGLRWFRSGRLTVRVGALYTPPEGLTPEEVTRDLEERVRKLLTEEIPE